MKNIDEFKILKTYLEIIGFKEVNEKFINNNLMVLFNKNLKKWKLIDTSIFSNMAICSIVFPFDEEQKLRFFKKCSDNFKVI